MTAPSARVRRETYTRDHYRCVAADGECFGRAEWNHRESSGHGGRGSKAPKVSVADGVTVCASHNARFESDLLMVALRNGWKLRKWRGGMQAADIPYYDNTDKAWYLPIDLARANPLVPMLALELLDAAGNLTQNRCRDCGLIQPCACTLWPSVESKAEAL